METSRGVPAGSIGRGEFWGLAWQLRRELRQYVGGAVRMIRAAHARKEIA